MEININEMSLSLDVKQMLSKTGGLAFSVVLLDDGDDDRYMVSRPTALSEELPLTASD